MKLSSAMLEHISSEALGLLCPFAFCLFPLGFTVVFPLGYEGLLTLTGGLPTLDGLEGSNIRERGVCVCVCVCV